MTKTILHIDSSPLGDRSVSRKLTAKIVDGLKNEFPGAAVLRRDLGTAPLPYLDGLAVGAFFTPPDKRNEVLNKAAALSDEAVDELLEADIIVIGAPMYNFTIPSHLKSWFDHVVRAGRTFANGPDGLVSLLPPGQKVIVVSTRGQGYSSGPYVAMDHQETYLKTILGFIGLHDVTFVRAEGYITGEEALKKAQESAEIRVSDTVRTMSGPGMVPKPAAAP